MLTLVPFRTDLVFEVPVELESSMEFRLSVVGVGIIIYVCCLLVGN